MKKVVRPFLALSLLFAQGCGVAPDDGPSQKAPAPESKEVPSAPGTTTPAEVLDEIQVGTSTTVSVEKGPEGGLVVVGRGPRNDEAAANEALERANSVEALYAALARPVPASVREALDRFDNMAGDFAAPEGAVNEAVASEIERVPGPVDEFRAVDKEAPRNVTWFRNTFCSGDHMDEEAVREGWWRKNEWCRTEVTNGFNLSFTAVRQGFAAAHMYRGSATLRYHWQTTGDWTLGSSYAISEGNYQWVRVTIPTKMNLRFELINASGDGFNYSIHVANSNMRAMVGNPGQDFYHVECFCQDSFQTRFYQLEQCIANPVDASEGNTLAGGSLLCLRFANSSSGVTCQFVGVERRTMGENCAATGGQPLVNCTDNPRACTH